MGKRKRETHQKLQRTESANILPLAPLLFREQELRQLSGLVDSPSLRGPIYVSGLLGSGKSFLLQTIQQRSDHVPFAFVDCRFFQTEAEVVRRVISELRPFHQDLEEDGTAKSVSTVADLRKFLSNQVGDSEEGATIRSVLVLDGVEYLKKCVPLLAQMIMLQQAESVHLTLIFVGRSPWQTLAFSHAGLGKVLEFHLQSFTKKELVQLVFQVFEESDKEDLTALLKSFCRLIVDTFFPITKDVRLLRAQAQKHYSSFMSPILEGRVKPQQSDLLFRNFIPVIAAELQEKSTSIEKKPLGSVNLPLYLRYLLIAAYLCSYNPSQADARMLAKRHERVKKEKLLAQAKKKTRDKRLTVLGPQAFSFERLCSNFLSLTADHNVKVAILQIQANLKTLCDIKLLVRMSAEENLDSPKFKCICDKEAVRQVASSVEVDLNRFLIDLV